jgi:four helix bundle protein
MARFEALEVAFALARALGPVLAQVAQHDRDLASQLRRAGASAPSCLSEGAQRAGKDRLQLYRTAGGSAAEVRTQVELAVAWGYLGESAAAPVLALADRVVAMAWRLTHPRG